MFENLKYDAWLANRELAKRGLVKFNLGGLSIADRKNRLFAIKPAAVGFDELVPESFVVISFDGDIIEGGSPSEDWRVHLALYQKLGFGAVSHIVSDNVLAFAAAGKPIPTFSAVHARVFGAGVPTARPLTKEEIGGDYDFAIADVIKEAGTDCGAVTVSGHEGYTFADDAKTAVTRAIFMEDAARTAITALSLTPGLAPISSAIVDKVYK